MVEQTVLETVRILERRAEHLEKEAALLRRDLAQVVTTLAAASSSVVAHYTIEGVTYEITEDEVEAVRTNLVKPWPDKAVQELVVTKKVAERLKKLSPEARNEHFFKTVEAIRSAAIADGTVIDTEAEAAWES